MASHEVCDRVDGDRLLADRVDVAGAKRARLSGLLVVGVAQHAAGVVCEQVDRDRGDRRGGADAMDVVRGGSKA